MACRALLVLQKVSWGAHGFFCTLLKKRDPNITVLVSTVRTPGFPEEPCSILLSEPSKNKQTKTKRSQCNSFTLNKGVTCNIKAFTTNIQIQLAIPGYPNRVLFAENDKMHWEPSPTCLLSLWEDVEDEALLWVGVDVLWAGDMPFSSELIAAITLGMCTWDHPNPPSNSQRTRRFALVHLASIWLDQESANHYWGVQAA